MGIDDLVVGFDIWSPAGGALEREEGKAFSRLVERVTESLWQRTEDVAGALVEPKKHPAVHHRLVNESERRRIEALIDEIVPTQPDALKLTPGKRVYEIQPNIYREQGRRWYLLEALDLLDALGR